MKNTLIKVLSFVMALTMLTSVFVTGSFAVDETAGTETQAPSTEETTESVECEHQWALEAIVEEPTCEGKPGDASHLVSIFRVCELCEEKELVATYDKTVEGVACNKGGHPLTAYEYEITAVPDCENNGTATFTCPTCGDGYENIPVKALGHAYGAWEVVTPAACGVEGLKTKTCARCDKSVDEKISALTHKYEAVAAGCDCIYDNRQALINGTFEGANGVSILANSRKGNCFEKGYQLKHCVYCDDLVIVWDDEPTHNWAKTKDENNKDTELFEEVFPANASVCIQYKRVFKKCADCGFEKEIEIINPVGHQWGVIGAIQTTQGVPACADNANFCTRKCGVCNVEETGYFPAKDHSITYYGCPACDAAGKACTDCTHADRYLACEYCKADSTKTPAVYEEHAYDNDHRVKTAGEDNKATCYQGQMWTYTCTNAGCTHTEDERDNNKDANNHGNGWIVTGTQEPTCTTAGKQFGYCSKCDYHGENVQFPTSEAGKALGHNFQPVDADHTDYASTCQKVGYDFDEYCTRCNAIEPGKGEIAVNPNAHPSTDKTVVGERYATCSIKAAKIVKYTECGCIAVDETTLGDYDADNHVLNNYEQNGGAFINSESLLKDVAAVTAYCTTAGSKAYTYCAGCNKVVKIDGTTLAVAAYVEYNEAFKNSMVIAALGHLTGANRTLVSAKIAETCVAPGKEAAYVCGRALANGTCDHATGGEVIEAHGKQFTETYTAKEPTCTETGVWEGTFCSKCGTDADCTYCENYEKKIVRDSATNGQVRPALGHDVQAHAGYVVTQSCDTTGYVPHKCTRCYATDADVWYVDGYAAATGDHTYPDAWDETNADPSCTEDGYKFKVCTTCTDGTPEVIYDEEYAASEDAKAPGHKYNGAVIELGCTTYEPFVGTACSVCGKVAGTNIEHNYVTVVNPADCENDGTKYFECTDCHKKSMIAGEEVVQILPALGHKYGHTVEYVFATATQDGHWTWVCATCGEEQVEVLPATQDVVFDIDVTPYIEGVDAEDLVIVNGGYIKVTIAVTAENYGFTSFKHTLAYDADMLTYVGAELEYDFADVAVSTYDNNAADHGLVTMSIFALSGAVLNGEEVALVSYLFQIAPAVDAIEYLVNAEVWFANDEGANYVLNQLDGDVDVALMGDLDNDGAYTPADVLALIAIVEEGEYNNVADINNDGYVDTYDFAKLAKFATSPAQTIDAYFDMFDIDLDSLVEAYEFDDYNHDGLINEKDAKMFKDTFKTVAGADWEEAVMAQTGDLTAILDIINGYLLYQ